MDNKNVSTSKTIRVLIISDRLMDQAKVLAQCLSSRDNIKVVGIAKNNKQVLNIAKHNCFDYLIIAGYLKDERTYGVITEVQNLNKKFLVVHWSMLDSLINRFCLLYKIPLKFERTLPVEDFISFLDAHNNDPIPCYQTDTYNFKTISNEIFK